MFLTCADLDSTLKRAMDTWSLNHKNIKFTDVTAKCAHIESTDEECPAAELFIVPNDEGESSAQDLAAWVTHNLDNAIVDREPYSTSGVHLKTAGAGGIGVRKAKMTVRAPDNSNTFCW